MKNTKEIFIKHDGIIFLRTEISVFSCNTKIKVMSKILLRKEKIKNGKVQSVQNDF